MMESIVEEIAHVLVLFPVVAHLGADRTTRFLFKFNADCHDFVGLILPWACILNLAAASCKDTRGSCLLWCWVLCKKRPGRHS